MKTTYEDVVTVEVPKPTRSYQPLSNVDLITNLRTVVNHFGHTIRSEHYELGAKDQQLFGTFVVQTEDNIMEKCIGFRNSYNKTLPVGLVAGSSVIVCSNLMFEGDIKKIRKHTVNMFDDIQRIMIEAVESIDNNFNTIKADVEHLMQIQVDKHLAARLAADMYMTEELITINQLSVVKQEWDKFEKGTDNNPIFEQTGWDLMNHFTEALKKSHPSERMERQVNVHRHLINRLEEWA